MARNPYGTHSDLIHCDNCGEDYSSTYKRCPFCGARPASTQATGRLDFTGRLGTAAGGRAASSRTARGEQQSAPRSRQSVEEDDYVFDGQDVFDDPQDDLDDGPSPFRASGGRHLSGGGLGISPTTLISFVVSGIIVLAAILIVILVVIPMIKGGKTPPATNSPNGSLPGTSASQPVSPSPSQPVPSNSPTTPATDPAAPATDPAAPSDSAAPTDSPLPSGSASPNPSTSAPPSGGSLTLVAYGNARTDISISDAYPNPVQFQARGASGTVTWKSSNTAVATVSANGVVTGVGRGEAAVTATDAAGNSGSCRVLVTLSNPSAPPASTSTSPAPSQSQSQAPSSGSLTLSQQDFTMSSAYPTPITIRASGASGTVTWSSSNTNVATVDANGKVSMVGKGQCRITATDAAGNSASCIVRVN